MNRRLLKILKNKYVLTFLVFMIYVLFLDDVDIFSIGNQKAKLNQLKQEKEFVLNKYNTTKSTLNQLSDIDALERYAREKKLFKRDDEDIFVIDHNKSKAD